MNAGQARVLRLAGSIFAALILTFVIVTAHPAEIWDALRQVDPVIALAVVTLNLALIALFTLRSGLLLRFMGYDVPLHVLVPTTVLGNVAGALTPGGSGEILRAAALQRSAGLRLADAVAMVAYERVLSTYLLLLSSLASLSIISLNDRLWLPVVLLCLAFTLLPWLAALQLLPRLPSPDAIQPAGLPRRLLRYGLALAVEMQVLLRDLRLLITWTAITLASFAVVAAQFALAARSIGQSISVFDGWMAFGGSVVATIASFLPFGIGVGDGSIAAILNQTGVPFERAAAIAVLVRVLTTIPLILLATASYLYLWRFKAEELATPDAEVQNPQEP